MQVPQVNLIDTESLQRLLARLVNPLRSSVRSPVAVRRYESEFGCEENFAALAGLLEPTSKRIS